MPDVEMRVDVLTGRFEIAQNLSEGEKEEKLWKK